jgi:transposase
MATDPELVERARTLRRDGLSIEQIATRLDLRSRAMVYRWVRDLPVPQWTIRPNAKDDLRELARAMRTDGATYDQIVERLRVSKSSVSLWVRDLPHPERTPEGEARRRAGLLRYSQERSARVAHERRRAVKAAAVAIGDLTERELVIAGSVAYWAEGTKRKPWNPVDRVVFTNSDVDMIRLFLAFLARTGVSKDRIRLRLAIHESANVAAATHYWSETLCWPVAEFQKVTLKRHVPRTPNRKNTGEGYHGCLVVTVQRSSELYRQIEGMWTAVAAAASSVAGQSRVV